MILNLTQHQATAEQAAAGVCDLPADKRASLAKAMTFASLATIGKDMGAAVSLAVDLAREAGATAAMIGGAPFFMPPLEAALRKAGITPLYAFSLRESVEETLPDGTVRKAAIFRHLGFVPGFGDMEGC